MVNRDIVKPVLCCAVRIKKLNATHLTRHTLASGLQQQHVRYDGKSPHQAPACEVNLVYSR